MMDLREFSAENLSDAAAVRPDSRYKWRKSSKLTAEFALLLEGMSHAVLCSPSGGIHIQKQRDIKKNERQNITGILLMDLRCKRKKCYDVVEFRMEDGGAALRKVWLKKKKCHEVEIYCVEDLFKRVQPLARLLSI